MNIHIYHAIFIVAGCTATLATLIVGLNQALKRAGWSVSARQGSIRTVTAVLLGWFAGVLVLASMDAYSAAPHRLPTIEFGIFIPIVIGVAIIWRSAALSQLIDAVPRHWVIAIQAYRIEGLVFLVLYATGRLPGLFALPAGIGDFVTGITALGIGVRVMRRNSVAGQRVLLWNLFGIADLIVALTTAFLTAPSPLQRSSLDQPNELISRFPLVLIPTFLVPLAILLHIVSLIQLMRASTGDNARPDHLSAAVALLR
jgi:hypothetical protein